jgi:hypothetical protein
MQGGLMLGVMDDSMDGKLQPAELKGNLGENLRKYFALIDTNKDGGISQAELTAAQKLMPGRKQRNGAAAAVSGGPAPSAPGA